MATRWLDCCGNESWRKSLFSEGWERVKGWECLYKHKKSKLFLSVYVDDFKMVGKTESLGPMWKRLEKKIDLEGPTPIMNQVYLGCSQRPAEVDEELIASKAEFLKRITTSRVKDDSVPEVKPEPKADKKRKSKPKRDTHAWSYDMEGHAVQCVEIYCELAKKKPDVKNSGDTRS